MTLPDLLAACTPGPWSAVPWNAEELDPTVVVSASGTSVATSDGGIVEQEVANMALIALTPELAALLIEARHMLGVLHDACLHPDDCNACALLARIDGLTDRRTET